MSFGILGLAAVALVVIVLVLAMGGGKGGGMLAALVGLLVLGGAAFFFVSYRAPPMVAVAVVPATVTPTPAAPPSGAGSGEEAPSRAVRGRVFQGSEGEIPFAGVAVEALPWPGGPATPTRLAEARSGADGSFLLEGLPLLDLRVRGVREGHACAAVKVAAASKEEVVLRLVKGARVAGKVVDRDDGTAIVGALVSWGDAVYATTDAAGAFVLDPVEADRTSLHVRAKGYARHRESVRVPEGGKEGVEIKLRPAATVAGTVFGPDGAPCAGARVDVESLLDLPFAKGIGAPTGIDDVVSGADGKYAVEDAPSGRKLRLRARTENAMSEAVTIEAIEKGAARRDVDLALHPAGTVVATVLDEKGAPIPGVAVRVSPAAESQGVNTGFMRAVVRSDGDERKTDERGVVRVGPVAPGPVKVQATKDDFREAETAALCTAGAETPVAVTLNAGVFVKGKVVDQAGAGIPAAKVTVSRIGRGDMVNESRVAGADGTFRVGGLEGRPFVVRGEKTGFVPTSLNNIEPGTEVVVTLHPGGTITGVATDPEGAPVRRFRIFTKRQGEAAANPMDWQRFSGSMAGTPFEDAAGRFRVEGLEPGTYEVEARADDLAPGRATGVAVRAGEESAVALKLAAGLELQGVVVRKANGDVVPGARVKIPAEGFFGEFDMGDPADMGLDAMDESGDMADARATLGAFAKSNAVAGADGKFSFKGLEAGSVRLMVTAKGLAPATVRGIEVPSTREIRVELGEEAGIEGFVTDAQGAAKSGMTVMLQRIPVFMRFAQTDDQGHYRIGGVAAGSYLFYVMDPAAMAGGGGLNMKSESVALEEGKTVRKDHKLGEGTKVLGRVSRGGKPVNGVMVMLFPASRSGGPMGMLTGGAGSGFAMGSSKEDGSYEITGVSPGRYTVSIQTGMGGAPSAGDTIEVAKGATEVRHDVALPEFGIRGLVVDEGGKPIVGAAVSAIEVGRDLTRLSDLGSALESMGGQDFTDDEGRFSIDNVKALPYKLQVQAEGYESGGVDNVTAVEGGPEVRITLRRGLEVTVKVVGPEGSPIRGASVFLQDSEGRDLTNLRGFDNIRTGDDGKALLRAPTGNLRFEAIALGFAPGETAAAVPASGEIVVRLPKGASVRVVVKDGEGLPVVGAGVELVGADGKPWAQRISMDSVADLMGGSATGSDGGWSRKDLPAGPWKVRAALPDGRTGEESVTLVEGETAQAAITLK